MNEQKKVTLPGSISNIPTTNYGRAYSIMSTWGHMYTADEMKRMLIGRGVDITDIDVDALHKACTASLEGLTEPNASLEITYEDGTKESRSASASLMKPKTPEEQENAWTERKRGLIVAALARHQNDPAKLIDVENLTQRLFSKDRSFSERGRDMMELSSLLGVGTLNEDPAWETFKSQLVESVPGMHRPTPNRWSGESELARLSDYDGRTRFNPGNDLVNRLLTQGYHSDEVKLADLGVGKLLDAAAFMAPHHMTIHTSTPGEDQVLIVPKPAITRQRLSHPYGHAFRTYSDDYLRELAIKRKAKRIKNQRRRRNAKARRK
ncbi:hypothetical protein pEaSNUABM38_00178 [Erwinia phage pEa_SNUABM_38]|nr:hypothetical protein pEaSNUABM38_00178 [Erwinia phage pEa_SNUABM_38]